MEKVMMSDFFLDQDSDFLKEWFDCLVSRTIKPGIFIKDPLDFFDAINWDFCQNYLKLPDYFFCNYYEEGEIPPYDDKVWHYLNIIAKKAGLVSDKIFTDKEYEDIFI